MNAGNQTNSNRGLVILALWVPLVFTLLVALLAYQGQHSRDVDARWVLHTVEVKDRIDRLHNLIENVETSERGYLLTGDTSYLAVYEKALEEIPDQNQSLALLIADNPTQVAAAAHLQTLITEKLSIASQTVSLAQQGQSAGAIQIVKEGRGKQLMDEIRLQVGAMEAEEDRLLVLRESVFASQVKSEKNEMTVLVAVDAALIVGLTLLMQRSRKQQLTADARIDEAHAMTDQAEVLTGEANIRTGQAEALTVEANTRTEQAEVLTVEANLHLHQVQAESEQAMRASELRYRRLFETAQDGILILEADTELVVDANPFMKNLLGYSREEIVGRKLWEIGPFKAAAARGAFAKLQHTDRTRNEGLSLETKDGRIVQVEFISNPYLMDNNRLVQCNIRDVTERKKGEQNLKLLNTCISHLNDIVMVTEAEPMEEPGPRIVFVNPAFEGMTGYKTAETLGRSPRFLQGEKTDRRVLDEIHQAVAQRKPIRRQIINYRKDGSEFWLDIDIVPIFDPAGTCTHFVGIERDVTEERRTDEQLLWKTAFFEAQVYSAHDGILVVDSAGRKILQNQRMIDLWNIPREFADEVEDRRQLEWVTAQVKNGQQFAERVAWLYAHPDEISTDEIDLLDGRTIDRYSVPVRDRDGKDYGRIWSFRDITRRKQAEARYRRLIDSNAQGVMFWNTKGEITGANDALLHLVRYSREDLEAGRIGWTAMTPPEYARLDGRAMEEISSTGACKPYEKEFIRKDGSRVPILIGAATFADNPEEGVAFVLDLSESRCAAEQIAEQAALLDEAQDAIIVRDLEGKALFWNKGAERMYGWTRQEVLGLNISEIIFAKPEKFAEVNALTISQGKWSGDLDHITKDKRQITVEARWTLIRDAEGRPKSVLAINTDVTEKKKIEAQFLRAQRMESIGTLAGGIAHDLNNILAPIMMSIDILKLTATDPQAKSILETIEISSKRGSDIVRQVLSFARGLEGERVEIQPAHLLKDLKSIIKDTFPKNIRLKFTIPNDIWMILGDPTQVHQILLNLCVNARDAMPAGGDLTIGIENCVLDEHYAAMHIEARAGRYVQISVTDSGTGIPQEVIDRIFEPFFTTKELHEGTGLGLSTVMAIVKSHEGIINVYSEPGKGTTFKVYLPAMDLSPGAQGRITQQLSVPRGNGETVLVVDDEASILTITSQTLQAFGYRVLTAIDGADAIATYAEHKNEIAVVLTDMSMPVMDGAAAIHALRRINPAIKIIAASGLNANGDKVKVSEAGVKHFLIKPYTAGTLLKTLRTILDEA